MDKRVLSLELVPMDGETPAAAPQIQQPEPMPIISNAARALSADASLDAIEIVPLERAIPIRSGAPMGDDYAAQAAREYSEGKIDKPLWDRAITQANGDAAAAAAIYVRARAVALKLFDRKRRGSSASAVQRPAVADNDDENWKARQRLLAKRESVWARHRYAIIAAALIVPITVGGGLWAWSSSGSSPAVVRAAAAAKPPPVAVAAQAPLPKAAPPDFMKKVQELRDAGNWNVLVLYAVEWTRKEPTNAAAWENLRMGYIYLRQYDDALMAATKATQLAPDEARYWRQLGEVNLELDDPASALSAFENAAARNSADLDSLHQVGLLQARLGRPQEAKAAFDRAAVVSPGDAITACLRAAVAQMPPLRDAYSMSRQIRAIDNRCHGRSETVASTAK